MLARSLLCALALGAAAPAAALSALVTAGGLAQDVSIVDAGAEVNVVGVAEEAGALVLRDERTPLVAEAPCTARPDGAVACPRTSLLAELGGGDDELRSAIASNDPPGPRAGETYAYAGGPGDDQLLGGRADEQLDGGPGADRLVGGGGDDELRADARDDEVDCGAGTDLLVPTGLVVGVGCERIGRADRFVVAASVRRARGGLRAQVRCPAGCRPRLEVVGPGGRVVARGAFVRVPEGGRATLRVRLGAPPPGARLRVRGVAVLPLAS